MTTNSVFSERLEKIRKERGKKRQEVADDIGITRASLENYEKGKRKPDIEMLLTLCEYYNVSADYLLGLSNAKIAATEDEQLKNTCDYTGLSEKAISAIRAIKKNSAEELSIYDRLISSHELNIIAFEVLEIAKLTEISFLYAKVGNKLGEYYNEFYSEEYLSNVDVYEKYYYSEQEAEKQIYLLQKHFINYIEWLTSRDKLAKFIDDNRMSLLSYKDGKYLYDLDEIAEERHEKIKHELEELKDKYREILEFDKEQERRCNNGKKKKKRLKRL